MSPLSLARKIILRASNVLAIGVLGLSAYTLSATATFAGVYFTYSALGIATAVIHLASVVPMNIISLVRENAATSMLIVEVGWLSFLCIMWLATGADAATVLGVAVNCLDSFCGATQGIAAFGFILWAMLMGYVITLLAFAIRAAQAGHNVWMTDVNQVHWIEGTANFEKPNLNSSHPASHPAVGTYPPNNMGTPMTPQVQHYHPGTTPGNVGGTYQV